MNDIEVSSIDLVEGGNVFKQGHYLTLGYVPRDEKGETVDLSGKTLNVALWGRKGVVFEAAATYGGGVIRFTFDKLVAAGDYTVEFTATSSTDEKYRKKFPTNQHSGRIAIKQSADDLGVVGIQVYTVAQLKAEQKALLDVAVSGFTVDSETKMARVSGSTTYTSLPARLEADKQATAVQLADKAEQKFVEGVNKRIDNLITHEGDGTKDSEIIDARFGVMGNTSDSLKERVDETDSNFLLTNGIEGTKQSLTFNQDGTPQSVNHKNAEGVLLREDLFSYNADSVLEKRTLFNGKTVTFLYNLSTFETTVLSQRFTDELQYSADYREWSNEMLENGGLLFAERYDTFYNKNFKENTNYGLLFQVNNNSLSEYLRVHNSFTGAYVRAAEAGETGAKKSILKTRTSPDVTEFRFGTLSTETGSINISQIRLFELVENSQVKHDFENLTAAELHDKYPKEEL